MVIHYHTGEPGRMHDVRMKRRSALNRKLENVQGGPNMAQYTYGTYQDKGYLRWETCGIGAASGHNLPQHVQDENAIFSPLRAVMAETWFKKQRAVCKIMQVRMKVQESPVVDIDISSALLTNIHTCCYGSQCSTYFGCIPPSLSQYMGVPGLVVPDCD
jgi:hypothetical protein